MSSPYLWWIYYCNYHFTFWTTSFRIIKKKTTTTSITFYNYVSNPITLRNLYLPRQNVHPENPSAALRAWPGPWRSSWPPEDPPPGFHPPNSWPCRPGPGHAAIALGPKTCFFLEEKDGKKGQGLDVFWGFAAWWKNWQEHLFGGFFWHVWQRPGG